MRAASSTFVIRLGALVLALGTAPVWGEIAFLRNTRGYWQLWLMRDDGSNQRELTFDPVDKSKVAWLSGGKELLYSTNMGDFYRLSLNGGRPKQLKVALIDAVASASFAVSPSGKDLALASNGFGLDPYNDLWIVDLRGKHRWKIPAPAGTSLNSPAYTADGKVLVYREAHAAGREGASQRIVWKELQGKRSGVLVEDFPFNFDQVVGPSGEVAFSTSRTGNYEIWLVYPGKTPKELTNLEAFSASPNWSPGGRSIAFESDKTGKLQIWTIGVDGRGLKQLTDGPEESRRPFWSPRPGKVR